MDLWGEQKRIRKIEVKLHVLWTDVIDFEAQITAGNGAEAALRDHCLMWRSLYMLYTGGDGKEWSSSLEMYSWNLQTGGFDGGGLASAAEVMMGWR